MKKELTFGKKPTMGDKMAVAKSRVGKNPGVNKGRPKKPKVKVRPSLGKKKVGLKIKVDF